MLNLLPIIRYLFKKITEIEYTVQTELVRLNLQINRKQRHLNRKINI